MTTTVAGARPSRLRSRAQAGALLFTASAALVHAGNYAFNLLLGRQLGPVRFSELNLMVTLVLAFSFAATTLQTSIARFVATADTAGDGQRIRAWLIRSLRPATVGVAALVIAASPALARVFQFESPLPFALLGLGIPVFIAQAVHRGAIQGQERFVGLAASYQAEMWTRLLAGIGAVAVGWGVAGATGALSLSFAASWLVVRGSRGRWPRPDRATRRAFVGFAAGTSILLIGEILVSHSDLVIAKIGLDPAAAGAYAAVSLVGRVAFFATWPVVAVLFPVAARKHAAGEPTRQLLTGSLFLVGVFAAALGLLTAAAPEAVLGLLFGDEFLGSAQWLWPYVLATGLFAIANTIVSYHLALGRTGGARLILAAGVAQVVTLAALPAATGTLVWAQVVLMTLLIVATIAWHRRHPRP